VFSIVVVRGSPYRSGNSDRLADEFLKGCGKKVSVMSDFRTSEMNISFCHSCRICEKTGICVIEDDARRFYKTVVQTDVLLVATSIHFGGLPSKLVTLVERAQVEWAKTNLLNNPPQKLTKYGALRRAYIILTGGSKRKTVGQPAIAILRNWIITLGFIPTAILYAAGYDSHDAVASDPKILKKTHLLGESLTG